jgi:hypothetical protein
MHQLDDDSAVSRVLRGEDLLLAPHGAGWSAEPREID